MKVNFTECRLTKRIVFIVYLCTKSQQDSFREFCIGLIKQKSIKKLHLHILVKSPWEAEKVCQAGHVVLATDFQWRKINTPSGRTAISVTSETDFVTCVTLICLITVWSHSCRICPEFWFWIIQEKSKPSSSKSQNITHAVQFAAVPQTGWNKHSDSNQQLLFPGSKDSLDMFTTLTIVYCSLLS